MSLDLSGEQFQAEREQYARHRMKATRFRRLHVELSAGTEMTVMGDEATVGGNSRTVKQRELENFTHSRYFPILIRW